MSNDELLGGTEEASPVTGKEQTDAVDSLDIAALRKFASIMKIRASRDWSKEDYVAAIKAKQNSSELTTYVFDPTKAPAPGFTRIKIHRDPSPNHKNSSVHVGVNGYLVGVPRGIEVDIQTPMVEALANAVQIDVAMAQEANRENPGGVYKDELRMSYPFQILAYTPGGEFDNPNDSRAQHYKARLKFFKEFGAWPTEGELKELKKAEINRRITE
jgi:hypothetical protein